MTGYQSKKAAANDKLREGLVREVDRAYAERGMVTDPDPYNDSAGTVKALISVIFVCGVVTLIFFLWGK
jgi:hypothetical protein